MNQDPSTPDLFPLVKRTAALVDEADLVLNWTEDEIQLIRDAHAAGLTVGEYEYGLDCAAAEAEAHGESGRDAPAYPDPVHYGVQVDHDVDMDGS